MGSTPLDKNDQDDLEYLAALGFEQAANVEEDVTELKRKVKARTFSYNNGIYFTGLSLLVGAFLAISLFFSVYEAAPEHSDIGQKIVQPLKAAPSKPLQPSVQLLDTVSIVKENFIRPKINTPVDVDPAPAEQTAENSPDILPLRSV